MTYPPDDTQHDDDTLRWSSDDERAAWVAPVIVERLREAAERSE